jgi:hypothetical protein
LEIFELIGKDEKAMPWLQLCVNHFKVTNIEPNYNPMPLFIKDCGEPMTVE